MREIIPIHVGKCGNRISERFWHNLLSEHGLLTSTPKHLDSINVYFKENSQGKFTSRGLFTDQGGDFLKEVKDLYEQEIISTGNMIYTECSSNGNWANGFYTDGAELCEIIIETIRSEVENCENFQGFQIIHSIGGGCGGGLGSCIASQIKEIFPETLIESYAVLYSHGTTDRVVEPYSTTLSLNQLSQHADGIYFLDNDALYSICFETFKLSTPSYEDLNHIISQALSEITSLYRSDLSSGNSMKNNLSALVHYPNLKYFTSSIAPLKHPNLRHYKQKNSESLFFELKDKKNMLTKTSWDKGKFISGITHFRGENFDLNGVRDAIYNDMKWNKRSYTNIFSENMEVKFSDIKSDDIKESAMLIANTSVVKEKLKFINIQFQALHKRKAFFTYYLGNGMDSFEFEEASNNLVNIVEEYEQIQNL
ncbi:hypothetical protein SteCoe_30874 [Stentor coeruleus]|uniref:Tubulin beta chain n=1 Tax=Stentor coeruleus TaxID=5963 RepID=A0A1R2B2M2_9CILI|nr:hypothetical protein SteCoe_30874 [Stentor coeruleus]